MTARRSLVLVLPLLALSTALEKLSKGELSIIENLQEQLKDLNLEVTHIKEEKRVQELIQEYDSDEDGKLDNTDLKAAIDAGDLVLEKEHFCCKTGSMNDDCRMRDGTSYAPRSSLNIFGNGARHHGSRAAAAARRRRASADVRVKTSPPGDPPSIPPRAAAQALPQPALVYCQRDMPPLGKARGATCRVRVAGRTTLPTILPPSMISFRSV